MEVITEVNHSIGWIKINRPKVLNSLNLHIVEKINEALVEWEKDEGVLFIVMEGEGDRAFCAGGDMKTFYEQRENNPEVYAKEFFTKEYDLDYKIHTYSKPIVVYMNGVVMGGGVGLSIGASHRIINEKTKWAMPEMNIGFFPDVGASHFLNKMPNHIGRYLALTAQMIGPVDALYVGAADYYVESTNWSIIKEKLRSYSWTNNEISADLDNIFKQFERNETTTSNLEQNEEKIAKHFQYDTVEEIVSSLDNDSSAWDSFTLKALNEKSPLSLKVALKQMVLGKEMSLEECFKMEQEMAVTFMGSHDFYEGIRSVLVDKDRSPNWKPATLAEVDKGRVDRFFTSFNI